MKKAFFGFINIIDVILCALISPIDDLCELFEITYKQLFISVACIIPVVTILFMMIVKLG